MNKFVAKKAVQAAEVALDYLLENQGGVFYDPESGFKAEGILKDKKVGSKEKIVKSLEIISEYESAEFMLNALNARDTLSKVKNSFYTYTFNDLQVELSLKSFDRYPDQEYCEVSRLQGLTLTSAFVSEYSNEIYFRTTCGKLFKMFHQQDCCENVTIEDIVGDLEDIIDTPILLAEETGNDREHDREHDYGTCTYTYYKLATVKGDLSIRWYGESNGYYSESVDFVEIKQKAGE